MKANMEIRKTAQRSGVLHCEIADKLGISESWFCKKLRKELSEEEKMKIIRIIGEIASEKDE